MSKFVSVAIVMGFVEAGCIECQRVIARGNFSLCIIEKQRHYLVGYHSPEICCGEERQVPRIFFSAQEAEAARENLVAEIKEYGDTSHLSLFPLVKVVSPTLH